MTSAQGSAVRTHPRGASCAGSHAQGARTTLPPPALEPADPATEPHPGQRPASRGPPAADLAAAPPGAGLRKVGPAPSVPVPTLQSSVRGKRGCRRGCYLRVRMPADGDGDQAGVTVAEDRVDRVERHAACGAVVDFYNLVTTPAGARTGNLGELSTQYQGRPSPGGPLLPGRWMRPENHVTHTLIHIPLGCPLGTGPPRAASPAAHREQGGGASRGAVSGTGFCL